MAKPKQNKPLSPVHIKFCEHYAEYGNATQAYLFAHPHVTYGTAKTEGPKFLSKPDISAKIEQLVEEFTVQFKQDKNRTIRDLIVSAEEFKGQGNHLAYLKAREMVIKLVGFYEPDKIEVSGNVNFDLKIPGLETNKDESEAEEDND